MGFLGIDWFDFKKHAADKAKRKEDVHNEIEKLTSEIVNATIPADSPPQVKLLHRKATFLKIKTLCEMYRMAHK